MMISKERGVQNHERIIPKKAKICPVCKKKQGLPKWAIVLIVILVLAAIGSASGGNSDNSETTTTSQSSSTNETQNSTPEVKEVETESEPEIEYTAVDVDTMMDDLQSNAMKAEDTYNDKYLEITGRLALIDSDGKYISVFSQSDEFAILGVQCFIKDEDAKAKVMDMSIGDTVTLKVHIKEVGEVMAYVADIIEIE